MDPEKYRALYRFSTVVFRVKTPFEIPNERNQAKN